MSTLLNIKTGQTVSGNTPRYATKGDVVQDINGNLYVVKRSSFDYEATLNTEVTPFNITTIAVVFENNRDKTYHYFITRDELNNYKIGDKIKINTPFGVSTVILVDKNINIDHSRATKLIDILSTSELSHKNHTVVTVRFINDKTISKPYFYVSPYFTPSINHLYWLDDNKSIVIIDEVQPNVSDVSNLKEKTFKSPTLSNLQSSFKANPVAEVKTLLSSVFHTNLNEESVAYLEEIIYYSHFYTNNNNYETIAGINTINEIMEEKTMNFNANKIFKNLEFGKINTDAIKFSLNGLAFKMSDGSYATYDIEKKEATDVSAFVMDTDFIFAMPVALKDIKKGDIIKHLGKFMIVEGIFAEDKTLSVIDPLAAEEKVLIPVKNAFGFSYYTKIVNIFDRADFKPSEDMPFGNILPFMLMSEGNMDNSMLFAMMMNKDSAEMDFMKNPLMMMALLNK